VDQNFEDVPPLKGNDKTGHAISDGYLRFEEPIEVIIDNAKNTTVDLYTVVINEDLYTVYGQMCGVPTSLLVLLQVQRSLLPHFILQSSRRLQL
jgi:hypothetical protein